MSKNRKIVDPFRYLFIEAMQKEKSKKKNKCKFRDRYPYIDSTEWMYRKQETTESENLVKFVTKSLFDKIENEMRKRDPELFLSEIVKIEFTGKKTDA